jgi:type II secretory ATPase GspE/PulE/Tfp pilus assembly ATPase PilB-like protein
METAAFSAAHAGEPAGALRIGELLVRAGHVTPEAVEEALAAQQSSDKRLGEVLVEAGAVSSRAVAEALALQYSMEFVDLSVVEVDPQAAHLVQDSFARTHQVLPVRYLDGRVVEVAVADPTDLQVADEVRLAIGVGCRLAVADAKALLATIHRTYRLNLSVTEESDEDQFFLDAPLDAEGAATIDLVNALLSRAVNDGASDIHLDPQAREVIVRERIDGVLRAMEPLDKRMQNAVCSRLKIMASLDISEKRMPQDGSFSLLIGGTPVDVRVAVLPTKHGEHVVLRVLQRSVKLALPDLGMSGDAEAAFMRSIRQPHGAVITCGPTGSGKTTTLYAALETLNEPGRSIATIEDPVEYQLPGINQMEVHDKIGLTFARGLRTILRSDPEVILVGEIRDEETAKTAVQAALTGHLVLTTLHTNDAAGAIGRLRNLGIESDLLPGAVNCIVSQRLARRLCIHCRAPYEPTREELGQGGLVQVGTSLPTLYRGTGCLQCGGSGYTGRVAMYELMPVQGLGSILVKGTTEEIFHAACEHGMRTLREDGLRLALAGVTSLDEVRRVTGDAL